MRLQWRSFPWRFRGRAGARSAAESWNCDYKWNRCLGLALLSQFGLLCQRLMTVIAILPRRERVPSGEVRGMAQISLWRLEVVECSGAQRYEELTQLWSESFSLLIIISEAYKFCSKYRSGGEG